MKRSRFTDSQILAVLKQAEAGAVRMRRVGFDKSAGQPIWGAPAIRAQRGRGPWMARAIPAASTKIQTPTTLSWGFFLCAPARHREHARNAE